MSFGNDVVYALFYILFFYLCSDLCCWLDWNYSTIEILGFLTLFFPFILLSLFFLLPLGGACSFVCLLVKLFFPAGKCFLKLLVYLSAPLFSSIL